jgi:hypothetical protein
MASFTSLIHGITWLTTSLQHSSANRLQRVHEKTLNVSKKMGQRERPDPAQQPQLSGFQWTTSLGHPGQTPAMDDGYLLKSYRFDALRRALVT